MHSYSVMSLVEELLNGNPGSLVEDDKAKQSCFNEDDPYW